MKQPPARRLFLVVPDIDGMRGPASANALVGLDAPQAGPSHSMGPAVTLPVVGDLVDAETTAGAFDAVVSLAGGHTGSWALRDHRQRLYCPFDDVSIATDPDACTRAHAHTILDFTAGHTGTLLVHCLAGQSRSTAVALAVAVQRGYDPYDAAADLLAAHPAQRPFTPNPLVLFVFDRVLSLRGELMEAGMAFMRF